MTAEMSLESAMERSGCTARGCEVRSAFDICRLRTVIQHGPNPEAVLLLTDHVVRHAATFEEQIRAFVGWATAIHVYEDGQRSDAKGHRDARGRDAEA